MKTVLLTVGVIVLGIAVIGFVADTFGDEPQTGAVVNNRNGDVNCSQQLNSIDAALILHADARIIPNVPCPQFADVDCSGRVTPVDALLILQRVAGIIERLPAVCSPVVAS